MSLHGHVEATFVILKQTERKKKGAEINSNAQLLSRSKTPGVGGRDGIVIRGRRKKIFEKSQPCKFASWRVLEQFQLFGWLD
jgi:hypothetical protein